MLKECFRKKYSQRDDTENAYSRKTDELEICICWDNKSRKNNALRVQLTRPINKENKTKFVQVSEDWYISSWSFWSFFQFLWPAIRAAKSRDQFGNVPRLFTKILCCIVDLKGVVWYLGMVLLKDSLVLLNIVQLRDIIIYKI